MFHAEGCAFLGFQTLHLPEVGRPLYCLGATSLLDRPLVALAGAHRADPDSAHFGSRLAERLAAAGFTVAAAVQTPSGRALLHSAAPHGPVAGLVYDPVAPPFVAPVPASADTALWFSIFPTRDGVAVEGMDVADRVLGALATAVVVLDRGGVPDAYYVAETAVRAGRPVVFTRGAAALWPSRIGTGAHAPTSLGAIFDILAPLAGQP